MSDRHLRQDYFDAYEISSAACLVFGHQLWDLMQNGMSSSDAGRELHIARHNAQGIGRLMRRWRGECPRERLAIVCYADPVVEHCDVARWFGETVAWCERACDEAAELRRLWRACPEEENRCVGIYPNDPGPDEIRRACAVYLSDDPQRRILSLTEVVKRWRVATVFGSTDTRA